MVAYDEDRHVTGQPRLKAALAGKIRHEVSGYDMSWQWGPGARIASDYCLGFSCPHSEQLQDEPRKLQSEDADQFDEGAVALAAHLAGCDEVVSRGFLRRMLLAYGALLREPVDCGPAEACIAFDRHRLSDLAANPPLSAPSHDIVVEVAKFLGAAAAGGVVGNRIDAGVVATARRMFRLVTERWRRRAPSADAPLTVEEAVEAARAAVIAAGYHPSRTLSTERATKGSWIVYLHTREKDTSVRLRVWVPPGPPDCATILIVPLHL
ncbi:hypothetical protein O7602_09090 [Micromonospora sp. WMMD1128]|uniref:hypothetical protein n=1 Tax=Micromonospora sp. WMMD1128 TaxID=3015150 RepID=UPI00248B8D07|nr:hypothetical protein [Micromonospora sp. WMMD1128]WBB75637.1 hypothetical protein O7602_09090 [Micromonospora sp. WMMD1128]